MCTAICTAEQGNAVARVQSSSPSRLDEVDAHVRRRVLFDIGYVF